VACGPQNQHPMSRLIVLFLLAMTLAQSSQPAREPGPPVGSPAPDFEATDQDGRTRSLSSLLGPNGALLVFYRSADW
jgi:AhpC/TSA family